MAHNNEILNGIAAHLFKALYEQSRKPEAEPGALMDNEELAGPNS